MKPGGSDRVRSNTLQAFFNESRIPPEDRRAMVKDTEHLVLAGAPGGSPLALDTVLRRYVGTYNTATAQRVAVAFGLEAVLKKLRHDPLLTGGVKPDAGPSAVRADPVVDEMTAPEPTEAAAAKPVEPAAAEPQKKMLKPTPVSTSGAIEFAMENGSGRSRVVTVQFASKADPARLWEIMTGYDHLMRFVPDVLLSAREGQDGRAVIVQIQNLARFMFVVFKVNLHLRVIEHPDQHTLEFERLAGEFESFQGALEITEGPGSKGSVIRFRATIVPKGRMMSKKLRDGARRFLVPAFEAIRAQAEGN